jgi:hypothetical protein
MMGEILKFPEPNPSAGEARILGRRAENFRFKPVVDDLRMVLDAETATCEYTRPPDDCA